MGVVKSLLERRDTGETAQKEDAGILVEDGGEGVTIRLHLSVPWGPRGNPLGYTQLSIGAKRHIRKSANTILSIKTPYLYILWRAKKKAEG